MVIPGTHMDQWLTRRTVLTAAAATVACTKSRSSEGQGAMSAVNQGRMPVLFMGHGNPMNAIEDSQWTRSWQALAKTLPTPRAILSVSAHWFVPGTFVTSNAMPETIHDFGGFPQPLFEVQYPAKGNPELATRISKLLASSKAAPREDWGLDHGTWSVLKHLRPAADVPVLQLSIDRRLGAADHLTIARQLQPLREEGVLILGSGNVTHNLRYAFSSDGKTTPGWAASFDSDVTKAVEQHDAVALTKLHSTEAGVMSHPTPDHYLPLIYAMGAASDADRITFPTTGFDFGSLSMRSVLFSA